MSERPALIKESAEPHSSAVGARVQGLSADNSVLSGCPSAPRTQLQGSDPRARQQSAVCSTSTSAV
eukprot:scaffold70938_cov62-Phaeocystis_antarctica.AAC.7